MAVFAKYSKNMTLLCQGHSPVVICANINIHPLILHISNQYQNHGAGLIAASIKPLTTDRETNHLLITVYRFGNMLPFLRERKKITTPRNKQTSTNKILFID